MSRIEILCTVSHVPNPAHDSLLNVDARSSPWSVYCPVKKPKILPKNNNFISFGVNVISTLVVAGVNEASFPYIPIESKYGNGN